MQFQVHDHLKDAKPDEARKAYDGGVTLLRQGHFEARRLISGLRPPILDESGVVTAIAHLANECGLAGGPQVTRVVTTPDGQQMHIQVDPATGQALALPNPGNELESRIDIARIEGQVKASSVKRVSEFVESHPEESVSLLRSWLHETS